MADVEKCAMGRYFLLSVYKQDSVSETPDTVDLRSLHICVYIYIFITMEGVEESKRAWKQDPSLDINSFSSCTPQSFSRRSGGLL